MTKPTRDVVSSGGSGVYESTNQSRLDLRDVSLKRQRGNTVLLH